MSFTQRNYPRVDINAPVVLTVENRLLPEARCTNISMGGMCIDVVASLTQQQKGEVEFSYESDEGTLIFKGEFVVRWIKNIDQNEKKIQFGMQFTFYDFPNLSILARIIVAQLKKNEVANTA